MTYVKTSQKEMAKTIKWHPRKKINCLTLHLEWHARLQDVPFFFIRGHFDVHEI